MFSVLPWMFASTRVICIMDSRCALDQCGQCWWLVLGRVRIDAIGEWLETPASLVLVSYYSIWTWSEISHDRFSPCGISSKQNVSVETADKFLIYFYSLFLFWRTDTQYLFLLLFISVVWGFPLHHPTSKHLITGLSQTGTRPRFQIGPVLFDATPFLNKPGNKWKGKGRG